MMDSKPDLAALRDEIDALDGELRALLRARADLVAKVARSKADSGDSNILRPLREAQQMTALLAWQQAEAASLKPEGLLAVWREIISMALAQQGGLTVYASADAMAMARAHFGASLDYVETEADEALRACADNPKAVAVLSLAEAAAPQGSASVIARLPILGAAACLCYGHNNEMADPAVSNPAIAGACVRLVARRAAQDGDVVLTELPDGVLVESRADTVADTGDSVIWGQYLPVETGHD